MRGEMRFLLWRWRDSMVLHLHVSYEGEVGLFLTDSFSTKLGCFLQTAFL